MADDTTMADEQMLTDAHPASPERPSGPHIIDGKHEGQRLYRVIHEDDEVVERTAREVARGSAMLSNMELWRQNFMSTVHRVRQWCDAHRPQLRLALVDIRSNKVLFYFVPESEHYDLELGNAMTDLEVELGGSAGIGYVETLQVPMRSLARFVGERSLELWRPADAPVEASGEGDADRGRTP